MYKSAVVPSSYEGSRKMMGRQRISALKISSTKLLTYRSNGCICSPFAAFDADTGTSAISATKELGLPEQSS